MHRCRSVGPASVAVGGALLFLVGGGASLAGQAPAVGAMPVPWSPLGPEAAVVREGGGSLPPCLLCPGAQPPWGVGTFGGGRNPAGLAREVGGDHVGFSLGTHREAGDYRSPLDPESREGMVGQAAGWIPLAGSGGLAGSAAYRESTAGAGARRMQLRTGSSSPWIVADSSISGFRTTEARLDAAGGWSVGALAIGLAVGYEAVEALSVPSRTPRSSRASFPAASVGAEWHFPDSESRVGAYGRWSGSHVTTQIVGAPTPGEVTRLQGYAPPAVVPIGTGTGSLYYHRSDAETRAGGVTVAGQLAGWALSLWGEAGTTLEQTTTRAIADAPIDRWDTSGWEAGGEGRGLLGSTELLVRARHGTFKGEAMLAGADSLTWVASESATEGVVEGRWSLDREGRGWLVVGLGARFTDRDRGDTIPERLRTEIQTRAVSGHVQAGIPVHEEVVLLGGYTLVRTAARGRLPHVTSLPTEARELLGPELAIAGTPSVHHAPWVGAAWDYRPGQSVRVVAGRQSFAPNAPGTRLAATPDGDRAGWSVEVGFVMR